MGEEKPASSGDIPPRRQRGQQRRGEDYWSSELALSSSPSSPSLLGVVGHAREERERGERCARERKVQRPANLLHDYRVVSLEFKIPSSTGKRRGFHSKPARRSSGRGSRTTRGRGETSEHPPPLPPYVLFQLLPRAICCCLVEVSSVPLRD